MTEVKQLIYPYFDTTVSHGIGMHHGIGIRYAPAAPGMVHLEIRGAIPLRSLSMVKLPTDDDKYDHAAWVTITNKQALDDLITTLRYVQMKWEEAD